MDGRGIRNRSEYATLSKMEKIKKLWFSVPGGAVWVIVILYGILNKIFGDKINNINPLVIHHMMGALIAKYGAKLKYHTDDHYPDSCLGCGFLKNSFKKSDSDTQVNQFWLRNSDIDNIYDLMKEFPANIATLHGEHLEKAVLRIMPPRNNFKLFGLWHTHNTDGDQCFVI